MGGFLGGYLGPALTAATQAANGYQSGALKAEEMKREAVLQQIAMQRQMREDAIKNALSEAQTGEANARASALTAPPPKPKRTPQTFKLNGKPTLGSIDESGTFYDTQGNPVTDGVEPFEKPTAQGHVVDPVTGEVKFFDPANPPQGLRVHPAPRPDSFTPVTIGGGEGEPGEIRPFSSRTGTVGAPIGKAKANVTKIESATNVASKARLEAAVSEMNNGDAGMHEFENKLASGEISINGLEQLIGSAGSSFTHDDPASRLIQTQTLAALNRSNPELARYIRRALSFAEGESMISNRPSDFRTKMSAFLSQAASGASPEMIRDIQQRRRALLDPLNRTVGTTHPAPASAPAQSTGNVDLRQPAGKPPLSTRIQQLRQQGVSKEQAKATLEQEGYDLHGGD